MVMKPAVEVATNVYLKNNSDMLTSLRPVFLDRAICRMRLRSIHLRSISGAAQAQNFAGAAHVYPLEKAVVTMWWVDLWKRFCAATEKESLDLLEKAESLKRWVRDIDRTFKKDRGPGIVFELSTALHDLPSDEKSDEAQLLKALHDIAVTVTNLDADTERTEKSSCPPRKKQKTEGTFTQPSGNEHDEIVKKITKALNTSEHVRTAWATLCKSKTLTLEPRSKNTQLLMTFWSTIQTTLMAPPTTVDWIVKIVKDVMKDSTCSQSQWVTFNALKPRLYLNPARHDADSLVRFLENLIMLFWQPHQKAPMPPQSMADTIVGNIKELTEMCQWNRQHWINFNADKKKMYLDHANHSVDSLVRFLTYLTKSSSRAADIEITQTNIDEHAKIVIEIINALNNSEHVRTAWTAFCETMCQDLNPTSKDTMILKTFLSTHQEALMAPQTEKDTIVGIVRKMTQESKWCESHWNDFIAEKKRKSGNPARHDVDFLLSFLENITECSPPANDSATNSSLKEAAKSLSRVIMSIVNAGR